MAVFFKTSAPPGAVVRAEHLFVRLPLRPAVRHAPLAQAWRRGSDGRLAARWACAEGPADASAGHPAVLALAS